MAGGHRPRVLLLLAAVVAAWAAGLLLDAAAAHSLDTEGFIDITAAGDDVRTDLLVDYLSFATVAGVRAPGAGLSEDPARELAAGAPAAAEYLQRRLQVTVDGLGCPARIEDTGITDLFDEDYARIVLLHDCAGAGAYEIRYSVLFGDLDPGHNALAGYVLGGETGEFVFDAGNRSLVVGQGTAQGQAWRFAGLGFGHILGGLDHVLFVLAFLLGARGLRETFGAVAAFTVAHSVALALAATGAVGAAPRIVEPLIALSIAYVAAENCLARPAPRVRLAAVFAFGLLHGMGFAGAMQSTGAADWSSIGALLGFLLGIELGQALLLGLACPALLLLRTFSWGRHVRLGTAGAIALVGLVWFFERL